MVSYTYNGDGIRTSKTVNGVTTECYLDSTGTILAENKGGTMVRYLFDESGARIGLYVNGTAYMYDFNVQGDVVAIGTTGGTVLARYTYDAWGNPISVTDASGNAITSPIHIANLNSFRYRGYYYDAETGFYYLQSRYYDPTTCRFINADGIIGANGDLMAYNLFAYCSNNPVNHSDPSGAAIPNGQKNAWDHLPSPGYIHNAVQDYFISKHPGFKKEFTTPSGGRMDLYNPSTGDAYEVKPFGSFLQGQIQLQGYIDDMGGAAHRGPGFATFSFQHAIFSVTACYMGQGLICYYFKINTTDELYNTFMKGYPKVAENVGYNIIYGQFPKKKSSYNYGDRYGYLNGYNYGYGNSYGSGYNQAAGFGAAGGSYAILWDVAFALAFA